MNRLFQFISALICAGVIALSFYEYSMSGSLIPDGQTLKSLTQQTKPKTESEKLRERGFLVQNVGEAPLRIYRYPFRVGRQEIFSLLVSGDAVQTVGNFAVGNYTLPKMRLDIEMTVADSGEVGTYLLRFKAYELAYLKVSNLRIKKPRPLVRYEKNYLNNLRDLSCEVLITKFGKVLNSKCNLPQTTNNAYSQMAAMVSTTFSKMFVEFPQYPIGVGAKWKVRRRNFQEPYVNNVTKNAVYVLRKEPEKGLFVKAKANFEAPAGKMNMVHEIIIPEAAKFHPMRKLRSFSSDVLGSGEVFGTEFFYLKRISSQTKQKLSIVNKKNRATEPQRYSLDIYLDITLSEPDPVR